MTIPVSFVSGGKTYSVTSIDVSAFEGCTGLTAITLPNSVASIGNYAFYECTGLTNITIPNSVTSIGGFAFFGCTGLTDITIPNSVTSIGGEAFYGCSGLTAIVVDEANPTYDSRDNCNAIIETTSNRLICGCKSTTIPNSVTCIGNYAFYVCTGLTDITIPNSVTNIGIGAFVGCTGLTAITIPNSVTSIGSEAFYGCSGLTAIVVDEANPTYDSRDNCNAIIETTSNRLICGCKSTTIPNSVTSIGDLAFGGCTGLTNITIPNSVTSIGDQAFAWCTGLTAIVVDEANPTYDSRNNCNAIIETSSNRLICGCKSTTIPNSVTSIGDYAFYGCTGLTAITIPNSVTSIGSLAFCYCDALSAVYCHAETVPRTSSSFYSTPIEQATLYVPAPALTAYQTTEPWSQFGIIKTIEERKEACATPTIRFEDGALRFECETDGAQFHYTITAQDVQAEEACATDGIVPLTGCYDITCYATAELYLPSETVTAQLYWIEPANEATSINPTPMRGITVQSVRGFVTITGLAEYEHISYYSAAGAYLGTARPIDGTATFTAPANTIVVVKIGNRSIKVQVR